MRLEKYLEKLEEETSSLSISLRMEILHRVKNEIEKTSKEGDLPLERVLQSMGPPRSIANRILQEKNFPPLRGSAKPKWRMFFAACLGIFGLGTLALVLLIKSFFPLIEVDEETGAMRLLGGKINLSDSQFHHSQFVSGSTFRSESIIMNSFSFSESQRLLPDIHTISIRAPLGQFHISTHATRSIEYRCEIEGSDADKSKNVFENHDNEALLNLEQLSKASCQIKVPNGVPLKSELGSGILIFQNLEQDLHAELDQGVIHFHQKSPNLYEFSNSVTHGTIQELKPSQAKGGVHQITLRVQNGSVLIQ
jgi:hypothetical protein